MPTEGAPRDQPSASIQPMEDVSAAGQSEVQKMLVETEAGGVTSQAGLGTQPVESSEVQPQQHQPFGHVTQSGEATQVSNIT